MTSELYRQKTSAKGGIESVKKHSDNDANNERKTSSNGGPYFVLKATNKQVIGKSEMYSSARGIENGIASVKANPPGATVVDLQSKE